MTAQRAAITVVIPSYRRTGYLVDVLRDLGRQDCAGMECIVVLQTRPSEEELAELVEAFSGEVRVYLLDQPNASLARNVGLREARHGLVLFLDDDVRIQDPGFLRKHARNFEDSAVPGVYGQVLELGQAPTRDPDPAVIEGPAGWAHLPANYARRCRVRNGGSGNLSVRRDWAVAVGGMDANFIKGARREETEFNLRYTRRYGPLVFDPDASLVHLSGEGGSRTWGHVRRFVPMHHIVGLWYFLLASIASGAMSAREAAMELRHIAVALLRNPRGGGVLALPRNAGRALWGLALAARRLLAGRRRLDTLEPGSYDLLAERGTAQNPAVRPISAR